METPQPYEMYLLGFIGAGVLIWYIINKGWKQNQ